jgi:GTPase SAR1 family protein
MVQSARNESVVGLATVNRGASASTPPALGQELGEIAAATVRLASEIRPLLNDEAAATLDKLVHDGEDDACRIAVIGQAKAGKSALINALVQRQRALYEMVLNTEIAARGELRSLEQQIAAAREGEGATAAHWAQEAEDLKRFNTLPTAIMEQIKAAAQSFDQLKGLAVPRLDAALREVARRHVSQARRLLLAQPRFIRHEHVWQHDTQPLRRDLEREFQAIHQDVAEQFRQVERAASAEIFEMVRDLIPENPLITEDVRSPLIDPAPSISALGETVAIELDEQWHAWWRLWHGPRQRAHKLEERLSAELNSIVDKLLQAADAELEAYIVTAVQRYSQLVRDVATTLDRRKFELDARRHRAAEKPSDGAKLDGAKPDAVIADYPARLKCQTQRINEATRIAAELKQLVRQCAAFGL